MDDPVDPRDKKPIMVRKYDEINKEPERVIDDNPVGDPKKTNKLEPKEKEVQEKRYVPPPPYQPLVSFPQRPIK